MTENKAALVTGGATRVGRFFATHLAKRGYDIALHYNSSEGPAAEAAAEIRALGRQCETIRCDFRQGDVENLIPQARSRFPHLSLLVNSASAYTPAEIVDTDLAMLQEQFAINFFAPFLLTKAFARAVSAGEVVNILDNKIVYQQHAYAAYLLSKKAFSEFTRMAAVELAPAIRVNAIAPGVILPAEVRTSDYLEWRRDGIPLKRQGAIEELGQALDYLLENRFATGQTLFVDGGESVNIVGRHSENYPGHRS